MEEGRERERERETKKKRELEGVKGNRNSIAEKSEMHERHSNTAVVEDMIYI